MGGTGVFYGLRIVLPLYIVKKSIFGYLISYSDSFPAKNAEFSTPTQFLPEIKISPRVIDINISPLVVCIVEIKSLSKRFPGGPVIVKKIMTNVGFNPLLQNER